jgi:DHA1 family bicyclomycin/chloramphenicol resistance-like MFS transporter
MTGTTQTAAGGRAGAESPRTVAVAVLVLGTLLTIGPLGTDLYLPAFPEIADDFDAPVAQVQLTLTAMMAGLGLGQLVIGPLSDHWGRRRPLLAGTALYTVLSLVCAVAPTMAVFIGVRFAQGLAGAATAVVARAVVRDRYEGDAAARIFSRVILVVGLAPILGPILGAALLRVGPWQLGFLVLAAAGALAFVVVLLALPESLPPHAREPVTPRALVHTVRQLLGDVGFTAPAVTLMFSFATMFTYISAFSPVSRDEFGASAEQFSLVFAVNTVALIVGTQLNAALIGRVAAERRLLAGLILALLSVGALAGLAVTGAAGLVTVTAALSMMMIGVGFVIPNATTLAITAQRPAVAGTASALLGTMQFAFGGALAATAGLTARGEPTMSSMVLVMAATAVAALAVFGGYLLRGGRPVG